MMMTQEYKQFLQQKVAKSDEDFKNNRVCEPEQVYQRVIQAAVKAKEGMKDVA
ncbi:hypothetical protein HYE60_04540 [Aggregatibacter actinomycetemcomitans]|uniref:hypothetical protein n=1 Tax=Aggregatibacter actinomycetemcomitans TaxID=714 RepID=UPI00197B1E5D|nr:hypothetical protein [Aggregatibacter actinomycetemcomitans]MBN6074528.1 hypothetical protein [Aggregatibacter actinomycetemcomitans]